MPDDSVLDSVPADTRVSLEVLKRGVLALLTKESFYSALNTFLVKEFSIENCKFLRAVMIVNPSLGYPAFPEDAIAGAPDTQYGRLEWIYSTFIEANAPFRINLSYSVNEECSLRPFTPYTFDGAFVEIHNLVASDSYRRLRQQLPDATVTALERNPDDVDWDATGDRYGATMARR